MSHPVLETLFFLKIARSQVVDSILESDIEDQEELINYIQNEASDYEIMHLTVLGEMPEQKFDEVSEAAVWEIFKESVIMNTDALRENMLMEDIMTIVYEMGPVSSFGYSSAAPILEFSRENGQLSESYISELVNRKGDKPISDDNDKRNLGQKITDVGKNTINTINANPKVKQAKSAFVKRYTKTVSPTNPGPGSPDKQVVNKMQVGKDVGVAAVGAAGLYGLYKLYKNWKEKRKNAKTPEEKAAAKKGEAAVAAKIKKAKGKK